MPDRPQLERLPAVLARTGKSRSQLYLDVKNLRFPAPVKIGDRAVAWISSEIDAWCLARAEERATKIDIARGRP